MLNYISDTCLVYCIFLLIDHSKLSNDLLFCNILKKMVLFENEFPLSKQNSSSMTKQSLLT